MRTENTFFFSNATSWQRARVRVACAQVAEFSSRGHGPRRRPRADEANTRGQELLGAALRPAIALRASITNSSV